MNFSISFIFKCFYALNCCENYEYDLKKCDTLYSGEEVQVFQKKTLLASSGNKSVWRRKSPYVDSLLDTAILERIFEITISF
jgi:hypothetical protein